jgi:hypothetical protein
MEDNGGTAAREEEADTVTRLESARKPRASRWRRRMKETKVEGEKKIDLNKWLKEGRSAFHTMTRCAGHLTRRGGAASGQSPVGSWRDQTRPVRADRTLTESGQRSPGELNTLDRTRWTGPGPDVVVTTSCSVQCSVIDP